MENVQSKFEPTSETVAEFPNGGKARLSKFDKYFDGKVWKIDLSEAGYKDRVHSFRTGLFAHARWNGFKVKTRFVKGFLFVQASKLQA